jgi:hypothetical protein
MNVPQMNHICTFDETLFTEYTDFTKKMPPHNHCTRVEESQSVVYTLYWDERITCVIQKDGPVAVMDYMKKPVERKLYLNVKEVLEPLYEKLATVYNQEKDTK